MDETFWEGSTLARERRLETRVPHAQAERIVAELRAFFAAHVEALEAKSLAPGDTWTAPEIALARRLRVKRTLPPLAYDPVFGAPVVAAIGDAVVVAHDAPRTWGIVLPYLAAVGGAPRELCGTVPLAIATITAGRGSGLSPELEGWLLCTPCVNQLSDLPAPWGLHVGCAAEVRGTRTAAHELVLILPLAPGLAEAFVRWNVDAGHTIELSLATHSDMGNARALRRAVQDRFVELAPPVGAARSLIDRLRVAERLVPASSPWPSTQRQAWMERFARHLERGSDAVTPATLRPEHLSDFDARQALEAELSQEHVELLDRHVPAVIDFAGALRPVRYPKRHQGEFDLPILESMGLQSTPTHHAVPLYAQLVGPTGRSHAFVTDIAHFWSVMYDTWFRNMLVAEFPKVSWPPVAPRG